MSYALAITEFSLQNYFNEIRNFPILSRQEEYEYACKHKETGCLESAHKLITSHLRYVVKFAFVFKNYGFSLLDLIQEGNIGLMMAVRKFDPYRDITLASYASWWIKSYIQKYIIDNWSLVKIGTTQLKIMIFNSLRKAKEKIFNMLGHDDIEEVAKLLNVEVSDIEEMETRLIEMQYDSKNEDGEFYLMNSLVDERPLVDSKLIEFQRNENIESVVSKAINTLSEREKYIVQTRLMCNEEDKLSMRELSEKFSISKERINQIEKSAINKLRKLLCLDQSQLSYC